MKKLLSIVLLAITFVIIAIQPPAFAADLGHGKQIFGANCAACHSRGLNTINPMKTLKKSDLEKYGMFSSDAIATQVTNGKAAMPKFGGRLKANDIEDVVAYVLEQAEKGWK